MDDARTSSGGPDIGGLILALAKAFHWAGLYGIDHPVLAKRAGETVARLQTFLASEPDGTLLLGIARDKVLYRDRFFGTGQELVVQLTESLYLRQVATLGFEPELRPEDLISLFRYLHESRSAAHPDPPEEFLRRAGIRGIRLSPYNYKEMLSRTLVEQKDQPLQGSEREEELWRILLTSDLSGERETETGILQEMMDYPDLFRAMLARARQSEKDAGMPAASTRGAPLSGDLLARILRKTGGLLRNLPPDRRREILSSLDGGAPAGGGPGEEHNPIDLLMARSLTEEFSDDEFLDLFGTILSIEGKAGERIRTVFEVLADDRNRGGALASKAGARRRESRKAKEYYDLKTWETIEQLLLARSETAYIGSDHGRNLESLSASRRTGGGRMGIAPAVDPALAASLDPEGMRERIAYIHLDLLDREPEDGEFLDLLEEIRKDIPNILSRKQVLLFLTVLRRLEAYGREAQDARKSAVREVLRGIDFGQVPDLALTGDTPEEAKTSIPELLAEFGGLATRQILDRLLTEPEAANRRALLRLAVHIGPAGVPEMIERLPHPKWYFVRNLCILLGNIGDRRALPGLLAATSHPDLRVRREALQAIGKLGAQEAVPSLGKILLDEKLFSSAKEDPVRIDAANALYRIGGAEAFAFLYRGKGVRRSPVRRHCADLLRSVEEFS